MSKYLKIGLLLSLVWWAQSALAQDTIPINTTYAFEATNQPGYTYSWWYLNGLNDTTTFASTSYKTEELFWGTEGNYQLFAQAIDINNCLSEIISKYFVVTDKEVGVTANLFGIPDFVEGVTNSPIFGNVSTNDFVFPDDTLKTIYSLVGVSLEGLTLNSDGSFIYQPPAGFNGKVFFTYQVCVENKPESCSIAEAEIRILSDDPAENQKPIASTDVVLTFPGQQVSTTLISNDANYSSIAETPIVDPENGTVEIFADGTFNYKPNSGFSGLDKFRYQICGEESANSCDSAWAYIFVNEFEDDVQSPPPSVYDDLVVYKKDSTYTVAANDFSLDKNPLVYATTPVEDVKFGVLEMNSDGTFKYTPNSGFVGVDWFVYNVCTGNSPSFCKKSTAFILVGEEEQLFVSAGNDTIIGTCNPYQLQATVSNNENVSYLWEPADNLDNSTSATPVFTPGGTTVFKVTVTNGQGNTAVDSVEITVSDLMAEAGEDVYIYQGATTMLDGSASIGKGLQYIWTSISGKIESGENTPYPIVSGFGTYYLELTDTFNCVSIDSVQVIRITHAPVANDDYDTTAYVTEVKIPVLDNDTDEENSIDKTSLTVTLPPYNGTAYVDFDDYTIHYRPNEGFSGTDNFEYQICNTYNNCDKASVYVWVTEFKFLIPDAFSPNGDGINDFFEIIGIEQYEGNSITIINRWGGTVYKANNYGINTTPKFWDGKANTGVRIGNEELATGTYFYVLKLGNSEQSISGSIYLDR